MLSCKTADTALLLHVQPAGGKASCVSAGFATGWKLPNLIKPGMNTTVRCQANEMHCAVLKGGLDVFPAIRSKDAALVQSNVHQAGTCATSQAVTSPYTRNSTLLSVPHSLKRTLVYNLARAESIVAHLRVAHVGVCGQAYGCSMGLY